MKSQTIRQGFIEYFKKQGHTMVPSSPVAPFNDPTLLFINAGMNQFKDVFLGKDKRDYTRATSSQKCVRVGGKHNDLENVGHTRRHMTFFEMLGNFSFGDYFKEEAMRFAYEVSTQVFKLDPEKIYVSVYEKDDEAYELWKAHVDESRIVRLGEKDNFWSMGDTGPCGPCSELLYDRGPEFGSATSPLDDEDGERFLEFWNLVFMQYNRAEDGTMTPLPKPCVDTGAGLERIMSLIEDVPTVFQTDILQHLIRVIEKVAGVSYDPTNSELAPAFHVIADHIRTLAFAIADGVDPSNVDRGYVLRKVLRRAVRYARRLNIKKPFLSQLVEPLIEVMGEDYRELEQSKKRIMSLLESEEKAFIRVLEKGGNRLKEITTKAKNSSDKKIAGLDAFTLKDTYGFPLEEIELIAKDEGLTIDMPSFTKLEQEAKEKSRKAHKKVAQTAEVSLFETLVEQGKTSTFVGGDQDEAKASIEAIVVDGGFVKTLEPGQSAELVLDQTSFYPEKGGQVGDKGSLEHGEMVFKVEDTQSPYEGVITHRGTLVSGEITVGDPLVTKIDVPRRREIEKHHSATHLLHYALQKVLGAHIKQAGSLVEADRLRFDFTHHEAVSHEQIRELEACVNGMIWEGGAVSIEEKRFADIANDPSIKQFFGDKYGTHVNVVSVGKTSKELCGGTHVKEVALIGYLRIASIKTISAGVKRIEAYLGLEAERHVRYPVEDEREQTAQLLKAKPKKDGVLEAATKMISEMSALKQKVQKMKQTLFTSALKTLASEAEKVGDYNVITKKVDMDSEDAFELIKQLAGQQDKAVALLAAEAGDKCFLFLALSKSVVKAGLNAGSLLKPLLESLGGRGGGKPDMARGAAPAGCELQSVFEALKKAL